MSLQIYDIRACVCNFAGITLADGVVSYAIAPEGPGYTDEKGADNHVVRIATNENRATASFTCKGSSKEHAKLSAAHALDVQAQNGLGVGTFLFKDENGSTLVSTGKAWIMGRAEKTFAQGPEDVTWEIRLVLDSPLNYIIGGN